MAKKAMIEREKKRQKLVDRYAAKRAALKEIANDESKPMEERFKARLKLDSAGVCLVLDFALIRRGVDHDYFQLVLMIPSADSYCVTRHVNRNPRGAPACCVNVLGAFQQRPDYCFIGRDCM